MVWLKIYNIKWIERIHEGIEWMLLKFFKSLKKKLFLLFFVKTFDIKNWEKERKEENWTLLKISQDNLLQKSSKNKH